MAVVLLNGTEVVGLLAHALVLLLQSLFQEPSELSLQEFLGFSGV